MEKIEVSGFEYIGRELSFIVFEDLWRSDEKGDLKWTSEKPTHYISHMEKGTVFLFSKITKEKEDIIHFMAIPLGSHSIIDEVELTIKELEYLSVSKLLRFTDIKYVKEISITPSGTLMQDTEGWTFNHPVYLPNDVYVVMGQQEYKDSDGKLAIGRKISLRDLLSTYSATIRQSK